MTTLVERVADALEKEMFKIEEIGTGRGIITPERLARIAIKAMREPTDAMTNALEPPERYQQFGMGFPQHRVSEWLDSWRADHVWMAMIDVALGEG